MKRKSLIFIQFSLFVSLITLQCKEKHPIILLWRKIYKEVIKNQKKLLYLFSLNLNFGEDTNIISECRERFCFKNSW